MTARWERSLSGIARGRENKEKFLAAIRQHAEELVRNVRLDSTTVYHADNVSKTKCPACGGFMLLVNGKRGKMLIAPTGSVGTGSRWMRTGSAVIKVLKKPAGSIRG